MKQYGLLYEIFKYKLAWGYNKRQYILFLLLGDKNDIWEKYI